MIQIPEYDPANEDSLTVLTESDVISESEARWFRKQLVKVAGKTLSGQPRLRLVWGPVHRDSMSTDPDAIKYLDFVHNGVQLGERRWFVEIHRTPEFLAAGGRYQIETRQDDDGTKLLKSLPSDGCYDYWLRLERSDLTYHPLDNEALNVVRALWQWEQMPQNERDALEQADRELERRQLIAAKRQVRNELWGFDPDDYRLVIPSDGAPKFVRKLIEI